MGATTFIPGSIRANKTAPAKTGRLTRDSNRVLVVEDLEAVRRLAKSIFEDAGLTVLLATDAAEALKILEETSEPIDLLFTDYLMPGMNGLELIEHVSARWPVIQLVLSSGYLDEGDLQRFQNRNITVLRKPYDMRHAAEVIVDLLS